MCVCVFARARVCVCVCTYIGISKDKPRHFLGRDRLQDIHRTMEQERAERRHQF